MSKLDTTIIVIGIIILILSGIILGMVINDGCYH